MRSLRPRASIRTDETNLVSNQVALNRYNCIPKVYITAPLLFPKLKQRNERSLLNYCFIVNHHFPVYLCLNCLAFELVFHLHLQLFVKSAVPSMFFFR